MHCFEIFAIEKHCDFETQTGGGSLKVAGNDTILITYDFLFTCNSNCGSILHRFWHEWFWKNDKTL